MSKDVTVSDVALDAPSLEWLDPATLVAHPANVRDGLGDVRELASSIALTGVIEPLVVIPLDDGAMRILAGHRRAAAAVAAGLDAVPCLVRPDLAIAADEQLASALAENIQREGLSLQEEARAYAQLSAFPGWSTGRIAQATGRDELSVRRRIEASTLAPELQPAAISGQLSLEDAARVASFADDPDTYATLLQLTSNGGLRHALVRAERRREVAQQAAEVRERLQAEGVRIVGRPRHSDVALTLNSLQDDSGGGLDPAEHAAGCEGHAVYIDDYDGEAVPVCLDPARFGHRSVTAPLAGTGTRPRNRPRLALPPRKRRGPGGKRWPTRRRCASRSSGTWLRRRASHRPERFASPSRCWWTTKPGLPTPDDLAWYLGSDDPAAVDVAAVLAEAVHKAPKRRLPALALAVVAVGAEDNLAAADKSWGYSPGPGPSLARLSGFSRP